MLQRWLGLSERLSGLPRRVREILEEIPTLIRERYVDAEIFLFGSYARGDWLRDSDIDLIVVSEGFEGVPWPERVGAIRNLLPSDVGFDILAYTPREFEEAKERSLIRDASRYWIRL